MDSHSWCSELYGKIFLGKSRPKGSVETSWIHLVRALFDHYHSRWHLCLQSLLALVFWDIDIQSQYDLLYFVDVDYPLDLKHHKNVFAWKLCLIVLHDLCHHDSLRTQNLLHCPILLKKVQKLRRVISCELFWIYCCHDRFFFVWVLLEQLDNIIYQFRSLASHAICKF